MMARTKIYTALKGVRSKGVDMAARLVVRFSLLAAQSPD
jgi:hypothetical protein